jgi:predicted DNA binding CopG/RHH family protein
MNSKMQRVEVAVKANAAGRRSAATKIKYTNEPLGDVKVIPDFLPSIAELAFNEEGVKITLALSKKSVDFFKAEADKNHTQYQRMIRRLLDAYVDAHSTRSVP